MASCAAIGNRRACRLPTGTQLAKLSAMGLRPTEVHENPFERRSAANQASSGAGDRVFPGRRGGFSTLPHKRTTSRGRGTKGGYSDAQFGAQFGERQSG
jgi:hypothetical protein